LSALSSAYHLAGSNVDLVVPFVWPKAQPIDLDGFARRAVYELFIDYEDPTATRTVDLDLTNLMAYIKQRSYCFATVFGFLVARAVNLVPEFRCRLEEGSPVLYEHVIPSFVVLKADKQIAFAKGVFTDEFAVDYFANSQVVEQVRSGMTQDVGPGNHGLFWFTNNPWNRFTSLQFPFTSSIADVPVFATGKITDEGGRLMAPFAFRIHHSFIDGYHVAHFLHVIQAHLADPSLLERPFVSDFTV
jgi:chloramphenicol O-acetyltransferase type A